MDGTILDVNNNVACDIIEKYKNEGGFVSSKVLEERVASFRNAFISPALCRNTGIVSGGIAPKRDGKQSFLCVDTEGQGPIDTLDTITTIDLFNDFDLIFIKPENTGRDVVVDSSGNIALNATEVTLKGSENSVLVLMKMGSKFVEVMRYPDGTSIRESIYQGFTEYGITGGAVVIDQSLVCLLPEQGGGTSATFDIDITSAGTEGTIDVTIVPLAGEFVLAEYSFTGSPGLPAVGDGVEAKINAGTADHGYTASHNGSGKVTVTMPIELGALANDYDVIVDITGAVTIGTPADPAGGVDQVDQPTTLNDLSGIKEGQQVILINAGTTSITVDDGPGIDVNGIPIVIPSKRFLLGYVKGGTFRGMVTDSGVDLSTYSIDDLSDVDLTGILSGQILRWDGAQFVASDETQSDWNEATATDPAFIQNKPSDITDLSTHSINELNDVNTVGAVADQFLKWNGSNWVPAYLPAPKKSFILTAGRNGKQSGAFDLKLSDVFTNESPFLIPGNLAGTYTINLAVYAPDNDDSAFDIEIRINGTIEGTALTVDTSGSAPFKDEKQYTGVVLSALDEIRVRVSGADDLEDARAMIGFTEE